MILALDMGNTNIVVGCIDNDKVCFTERMSTDPKKTELEYAVAIKTVLELYGIDTKDISGAIISSVVPPLDNIVKDAIYKVINKKPMIVGPGLKNGLNLLLDNPKQVGSDLVVDAVATISEYGFPAIIIDMGTATTISVVDKNRNYIGGMILPGIKVSLESLTQGTAKLPKISLEAPKQAIGRNTVDCMKSGIIYGNAAAIDGMIERIESELGYKTTIVATGGLASVVVKHCKRDIILDDELLLKGLKIIYDKNK